MISGIGGSTNYFNSLFATNGTGGSSATSSLAQTEEKLFARIDSNGDGSLSQSEFTSFLDQAAAATGGAAPSTAQANALFSQMSNGGNSISLQQFESNAGDLPAGDVTAAAAPVVTALQNEIAAGSSSSATSSTSALLSQLTRSVQSLVAGSAAGITSHNSSNATSNTNSSNSTGHHRHHGHDGGGSLISQFMQQYQAAGATASSTLSTTA